ncbi:hypothetical protein [Mastigocoleus testarum]|uniref:Uncharacterized protein n=1 Tax=Mastigocoleus testarum BC008 TaxID=371196 RepID=A0A0V7ZS93_9CYAN|nr:hypothetical protein [Mastigocoleus testarum]KST67488.1 hypothetical protein BC008_30300 [Mastigocoleus testarum BC008]
MSNKPNQTKVKVCNHKPGDKWDDGCCGNESAKNQNSEITGDDQSAIPEVYRKQNNQASNEQQAFNSQENTLAEHQE